VLNVAFRTLLRALPASLVVGLACSRGGPTAEVWLTTGDRTRLLSREPDLRFAPGAQDSIATIAVDEAATYQAMVGFGAAITDASAWLIQNRLPPARRAELLQELFGRNPGIGLSFTRLTIGASDFSLSQYSYDDMPRGKTDPDLAHFSIDSARAVVLPVVLGARAINPRLTVMASPWSAPGWMKTTASLIKGTLRPDAYAPFADYLRRYIAAFAAQGVPIDLISIQNEPHFEPGDYPGMRLEPPARARFVGEFLGPLFQRAGIGTQILDWDHNWNEPQSPLQMLSDSVARRYVAGVAWHCYGGEVTAQSVVHDAHPDKDTYFTECSGGNWAPSFSDNLVWMAQNLIVGATRGWARGVLLWNLALDEHHGPHTGGCGDCRGVVTIDSASGAITRNEEYYALAHASRFVRPGARRIGSSSGIEGLESVAFRNSDDGSKAVIVVNTAAVERRFAVGWAGRSVRYTIPARAVVTLSWR
jgi:glucosylceramidase